MFITIVSHHPLLARRAAWCWWYYAYRLLCLCYACRSRHLCRGGMLRSGAASLQRTYQCLPYRCTDFHSSEHCLLRPLHYMHCISPSLIPHLYYPPCIVSHPSLSTAGAAHLCLYVITMRAAAVNISNLTDRQQPIVLLLLSSRFQMMEKNHVQKVLYVAAELSLSSKLIARLSNLAS